MSRRHRYEEIARILTRHGMGYVVMLVGLDRWLPIERGLLGHEPRQQPYARPEHVRLALEQLGATFVKLGQIVSTRPDLLSPELQVELAKLQDSAPPVAEEAIRAIVTEELGASPELLFARFDALPLASASIGQAHAATCTDGTEVVVKVRRPGIVEKVEDDLEILRNLAVRASKTWGGAADYDIVGIAAEFGETLMAELDYLREGHNAERFAADFADDPDVHIPRVFWDTTTTRVITLERLHGIKVSDVAALDRAGIDRPALAARATRVAADMIFEHGFFHADPHPGNLLIEPDGRIGILDFGMVGEVDEQTREHLAVLLAALAQGDPHRVAAAFLKVGVAQREVDRARLEADTADLLRHYQGRPLGQIPLGVFLNEVLAILRHHRVRLPRGLALLIKMVVMTEGMGAHLDPDFQLGQALGPYAQRLVARQLDPVALARRAGLAGLEALQLSTEVPGQLRRLFDMLDGDGIEVKLRAKDLEPLIGKVERIGNRLVAGIVAAAFIDGLSHVVTADPQRWRPYEPKLVAVGVAAAASLTGYVAWTARGLRRAS